MLSKLFNHSLQLVAGAVVPTAAGLSSWGHWGWLRGGASTEGVCLLIRLPGKYISFLFLGTQLCHEGDFWWEWCLGGNGVSHSGVFTWSDLSFAEVVQSCPSTGGWYRRVNLVLRVPANKGSLYEMLPSRNVPVKQKQLLTEQLCNNNSKKPNTVKKIKFSNKQQLLLTETKE